MGVLDRPGGRTPEPGFLERKPMSTNTTRTKESDESNSEFDDRDVRALTEYMTVLGGDGDVFTVVGENENGEYQVDARKGRCTCPDHEYRNARCKHIRRVAFATGDRAIPAWIDTDSVDDQLGDHVAGEPRIAATDGGIIEATDDGEIIDGDENDDRPDDCQCLSEYIDDDPLACWACCREGFDSPNPNVDDD